MKSEFDVVIDKFVVSTTCYCVTVLPILIFAPTKQYKVWVVNPLKDYIGKYIENKY